MQEKMLEEFSKALNQVCKEENGEGFFLFLFKDQGQQIKVGTCGSLSVQMKLAILDHVTRDEDFALARAIHKSQKIFE